MKRWIFLFMVFIACPAGAQVDGALLREISSGDENAIDKAFVLLTKSDGSNAEDLDVALGRSLTANPKNFLSALKKNRPRVKRLSSVLGNFGEEYIDNLQAQKTEIRKRLQALQSVKDKNLNTVTTECIEILKKRLLGLEAHKK